MANQQATSSKTRIIYAVDTLMDGQPASVNSVFRLYLIIPTTIGFLLNILLLWLYPLLGKPDQEVQAVETEKKQRMGV